MKNYRFYFLLLIPAILLALKLSAIGQYEESEEQQLQCSQYGIIEFPFNGNHGCPYAFDFNSLISSNCELEDIDLDKGSPGIQHYKETQTCKTWTNGNDGIIHMLPKSGYGGQGFTFSNDVYVHFTNNTYEAPTWTMYVSYNEGPYPAPCY